MSRAYRKVRIFIASPGDVTAERDRLRAVIEELEQMLGDQLGVVLQPLDWRDAPPRMGRPQQVIFDQLPLETCDIFVGILWHRFGTPPGASNPLTGEPFSAGTEEEFTLAHRLWKDRGQPQILIYRCTRDVPFDKLDPEQFMKVRAFFNAFSADGAHPGLVKNFQDIGDFERSVRRDLDRTVRELFGSPAKPEPGNSTTSAKAGDTTESGSATRPEPPAVVEEAQPVLSAPAPEPAAAEEAKEPSMLPFTLDELEPPAQESAAPAAAPIDYNDGLDDQILVLEAQVDAARRQINILTIRRAKMGINTDAATIIEIEDNERAQIAAMDQIVAIRSERVERLKRIAGGPQAAQLIDAQRALLDDTIRQKSMELRVQERKATEFGGRRTPHDAQIAALKGQIEDLRRQRDALGK